MTDSSTDKAEEPQKGTEATDTPKKVPIEAVAKERAEKRAARAEAAELRSEVEKLKAQLPNLDMDQLVQSLAEITTVTAEAAVASALKPVQDEVSKWKTAAMHGLNEQQADAVASVRSKYPDMADAAAMAVARAEKPELFPAATPERRVYGGPVPRGDSPYRTNPEPEDFLAKMRDAKSTEERTHWAEREFFRRVNSRRPST